MFHTHTSHPVQVYPELSGEVGGDLAYLNHRLLAKVERLVLRWVCLCLCLVVWMRV